MMDEAQRKGFRLISRNSNLLGILPFPLPTQEKDLRNYLSKS
jgi:hypothetical protein